VAEFASGSYSSQVVVPGARDKREGFICAFLTDETNRGAELSAGRCQSTLWKLRLKKGLREENFALMLYVPRRLQPTLNWKKHAVHDK
jgi:hypothetical protein